MYKPIVVIGAPRSGTNMLRDILCSFSGVGTWPCDEINYIWRHGNIKFPTDEFTRDMATPYVKKYIRNSVDKLAAENKLDFVVEKTCANTLRVGFVDEILPEAHYVCITRNALDVVASANLRWTAKLDIPYLIKKVRYVPFLDLPYYATRYCWSRVYRLFSGEKRLAFWGPQINDMKTLLEKYSLNEVCAIQWRRCVENSEKDFKEIDKTRISYVSYEKFVGSPKIELERILTEIGIVAAQHQIKESISKVSDKSVGKYINQLSATEIEKINGHINREVK